jgi:choice-of-anchor B domain-containing protein
MIRNSRGTLGRLLGFAFVCAVSALLSGDVVAQYATSNMELTDRLSLSQLGGGEGSDIWGWTDPLTKNEYAIFARSNGTSFVDVTDPYNVTYLGTLPTAAGEDVWRDVKTYGNYAYVVADGNVGPHGMQVFDMTRLRGVTSPQVFNADFNENSFRNAHNIAINEESGFAYVVGTNVNSGEALAYDLSNPAQPELVGLMDVDAYVHDLQVVNYHGPDTDYSGQEIMFTLSANDLVIIDVDNKSNPSLIWESQGAFNGGDPYNIGYVHQGWLSEDHRFFYQNDEGDNRWTHRWDVSDLDDPQYLGSIAPLAGSAIDHNLYVKGKYIYQANYTAGLRVAETTDPASGAMTEVSWLDTHPGSNGANFNGAWSVYPFFESGTIITSDINDGLFVSRVTVRPADFNADGFVDCTDIDQLVNAIATSSDKPWFDMNGDGNLDLADRDMWLAAAGAENLASGNAYLPGDIDLNGTVDGNDFVIWNANKFTSNPSWCHGDVNADGEVDGGDFIVWNAFKFQSADVSAVPEPSSIALILLSSLWFFRRR